MRFSSAQTEVTKKEHEVIQQTKKKRSWFLYNKNQSDIFNELVLYLFLLL